MDEGSQIPPNLVRIRSQGSNAGLSRNRHSTGSVQLYSGLWTDFPPFESKPVLYPSISPPGYSDTRQIPETRPQPTQISSSSYGGGSLKSPTLDVSGVAPGGRIEELDRDEEEDDGNEKTPLIDSATLVLKAKSSMKRSTSGGVNVRIGLEDEEERTPLIRQLSGENIRSGVLRNNNRPRTQQSVRIDTDDYPSEPSDSSRVKLVGAVELNIFNKCKVLVKDN
ncbi:uncharacterized protein LOC111717959 [Eurytemora carolleeae]|uniref:uncharacterized protein LOC111717959 n=1 Tax=Eurytemora carolleeae TaxID=1294199 RepID=UPI000C788DE6|nr:uncharacterized protein LOC111717959 [Eurytemora carolleeae]|eukprot:XP_023349194.1 uncharacterized protein LOC111717959 [Eurytemora affinis]